MWYRGPKVLEHPQGLVGHSQDLFGGPKAIPRVYSIAWKWPDLDLRELAKLRWIQQWSVARLAALFGRRPDMIQGHLCKMRKSGEWRGFGFAEGELLAIEINVATVFNSI